MNHRPDCGSAARLRLECRRLFVLLLCFSGRNLDTAKVLRSHPKHANKTPSRRKKKVPGCSRCIWTSPTPSRMGTDPPVSPLSRSGPVKASLGDEMASDCFGGGRMFVCFVSSLFTNSSFFYVSEVNWFLLVWRGKSSGREASPPSGSYKTGSRRLLVGVYAMVGRDT